MSSPVFGIVTNVIRRTQIGWEWLWFFSQRSFISGCFLFVLCEIFACILIRVLVLPGIPYRSTPSLTAVLPEIPSVHVLHHSWMHLFLWKRLSFCVYSSFSCCTLISGNILIQFELRKVCLLFLQRRIPFDCQLCETWIDAQKHNLISAQADC